MPVHYHREAKTVVQKGVCLNFILVDATLVLGKTESAIVFENACVKI